MYGGPDLGELRHWTKLDNERTRIASTTLLSTLLSGESGSVGETALALPDVASDRRWGRMSLREFYAGVGELSGAGPERGREQVRGVFAALIASLGDQPLGQLVKELHQEFTAADFLASIAETPRVQTFLGRVRDSARLASLDEAAIVSRATLAFLAARSGQNQPSQSGGQPSQSGQPSQQVEPHNLDE